MANTNVNKPFGFSPWRMINGAPWNGQANVYHIPSTDSTNYFIGDPVSSAAGADANGVPNVIIATTTGVVRGVIVGILSPNSGVPQTSLVGSSLALETLRGTASTDRYVLVADDPNIIFKAQIDTVTLGNSCTIATAANKNAVFIANTQTTTGYVSNAKISGTSTATTNTLNIKLMGLVVGPENVGITDTTSTTGDYAVYQCMFNLHELRGSVAGV